jgi:hypothetical protein
MMDGKVPGAGGVPLSNFQFGHGSGGLTASFTHSKNEAMDGTFKLVFSLPAPFIIIE